MAAVMFKMTDRTVMILGGFYKCFPHFKMSLKLKLTKNKSLSLNFCVTLCELKSTVNCN